MTVVVVGSVNRDLVCEVERLPGPGETVLAQAVRTNLGGKGSNQAVAAARAGSHVEFVARIGAESEAERTMLREFGIGVETVREVAGARTGTAYISVARGENQIVVDPGANFSWEPRNELDTLPETDVLRSATLVVAQCEIPIPTIRWAAHHARRFLLNAAPSTALPREILLRCDPLVVNESELSALTGTPVRTPDDAFDCARRLCDDGVPAVVATLGAAGSVWARRAIPESGSRTKNFTDPQSTAGSRHGEVDGGYQPAPQVTTVDSTGAGDAFVGALATALAEGMDLPTGVAFATAAAALAVRAPGTHAAYPDRSGILAALATLPASRPTEPASPMAPDRPTAIPR